ncbi:Hypothetical_protein [Hexamita inflata]|uniref:Hypothetical_protein n=2 Tax=Hexamita inflata TaxID=28002 RepID=A0AA86U8S1_9EUKA|nr:Hypothetical protein HINF_LOCUS30931 [Hexamita inflata]
MKPIFQYYHRQQNRYFAHSAFESYEFDQNLSIINRCPCVIGSKCEQPQTTSCVKYQNTYYGCWNYGLYKFDQMKVELICEAPELHTQQLFVCNKQLHYISRYGNDLYTLKDGKFVLTQKLSFLQPFNVAMSYLDRCFILTNSGKTCLEINAQFEVIKKYEGLYDVIFFKSMLILTGTGMVVDLLHGKQHRAIKDIKDTQQFDCSAYLRLGYDWEIQESVFKLFKSFSAISFYLDLKLLQQKQSEHELASVSVILSPSISSVDSPEFVRFRSQSHCPMLRSSMSEEELEVEESTKEVLQKVDEKFSLKKRKYNTLMDLSTFSDDNEEQDFSLHISQLDRIESKLDKLISLLSKK